MLQEKLRVVHLILLCSVSALRLDDLVITVISQEDSYNSRMARQLRDDIRLQASALGEEAPRVYLTHEDFPHYAAWMVFPILPDIVNKGIKNSLWFVFCEERTRFRIDKLLTVLSKLDHNKYIWLGHGITDKNPYFIHYYKYNMAFGFPLAAAGFVFSRSLLYRLARDAVPLYVGPNVTMDAFYEFSMMVTIPISSSPHLFCLKKGPDCVTYTLPYHPCEDIPVEDIYFAIKTCHKFHENRVPVVQSTWGRDTFHIEFFSDVQNDSIPTTPVGVTNTEFGHCAKTLAILKTMTNRVRELSNVQWVVLADDDTLINVPRLRNLLGCWSKEPVVVGERYGYRMSSDEGKNFPVAGAGVAISTMVLPILAARCACAAPDYHDDVALGHCISRQHITLVHSPFFHQRRPGDYPPIYLQTYPPVTLHKHTFIDPIAVYRDWLDPGPTRTI